MFRLLQNDARRSHQRYLQSWLSGSSDGFIAVAFLKDSGWRLISDEVELFLQRGGVLRVVVGTDFYLTDPGSLRALLQLAGKFSKLEWRLVEASGSATFHPKFYRFDDSENLWVMTGSANLTAGGLAQNIEASLVIEDKVGGPLSTECARLETALWNHPRCRLPTEVLVGTYAAEYRIARQKMKEAEKDYRKEIDQGPKLDESRLSLELAAYRANTEEQADLQRRRSNYPVAKALIESELLAPGAPNSAKFEAVYQRLVGQSGGEKLWHSGSVHRSKAAVISHAAEATAMVRDIAANLERSPDEMYELGLAWMRKTQGVGPNIFTEFCHTLAPQRYTPLNDNPVTSLSYLKIDEFPSPSAFRPADYGRLCRCLERLRAMCGFADLGETDHFLNFVYWRHKSEVKNEHPSTVETTSTSEERGGNPESS